MVMSLINKKVKITTVVCKNRSDYNRNTVWENAQDLEHLPSLHRTTNSRIQLLHYVKSDGLGDVYDDLVFRARRRFGFLSFQSIGVRRIVGKYKLVQIESFPLLGIQYRLSSSVEVDPLNNEKSICCDDVEVFWFRFCKPFSRFLDRRIQYHAKQQNLEDETFRERRTDLRSRGLNIPLTILNKTLFEEFFEAK